MVVAFYFDVVCPYAYLASTQISERCARMGADLINKPILLGGLFRTIGAGDGPMASMSLQRARMNLLDMHRWADHWGVPLRMPDAHPRRTVLAMRTLLVAERAGGQEALRRGAEALFRAYWQDGRDVAAESVVSEVLTAAGFDGEALVGGASEADIKQELFRRTDEAAAAGAFGVPTFVLTKPGSEAELYWGQDRIDMLERSVAKGP